MNPTLLTKFSTGTMEREFYWNYANRGLIGRAYVADSHFASVEASEVLFENNFRFIGVVKTATKRFSVGFFGS